MRLKDKVAIVTGSSQSIGKAIALRFASEGASVVVNYIKQEKLAEQVVADIRQEGGRAISFKADVSNEQEVKEMIHATIRHFGQIDILVNNAAIDPRKQWDQITVEEWDRVMINNARSHFVCSKAVYPYMKQQQYGKIINVSSVTFLTGQKNYVHYVASKGAIVGFTRALAREIGKDNITVNCIMLGAVLTETEIDKLGSEDSQKQASEKIIGLQAIPRRELPADIEGAFLFLASHESDFLTGQIINVDGGWMMH
jgi:3-oxoacyl-[acyl-carrier protein] reductase